MSDRNATILHEPARLGVVACLAVVDEGDFVFLQSQTGMTGGNLSSHLKKLDQVGYVQIAKAFNGSRPQTMIALTPDGHAALRGYLTTMRALFGAIDSDP